MPSCSASDAQWVDGVPPTAGGATMNAAAADAVTDARAPAARGGGCWRERCRHEQMGGSRCPPGICQRDGRGNPTTWHARPPCPEHDTPGRPFGLEAAPAAPRPAAAHDPARRPKALREKVLPTVHAYVECLHGFAADGDLTDAERTRLEELRRWLDALHAEETTLPK